MSVLPACLSTLRITDAHTGQKRVSDSLELEVERVVSHHMNAGNRTRVLWKSSKCS